MIGTLTVVSKMGHALGMLMRVDVLSGSFHTSPTKGRGSTRLPRAIPFDMMVSAIGDAYRDRCYSCVKRETKGSNE